MFTIALANQKGGSGKSTLAECLAVAACLDGKEAAILDIDPQGSAYKWAKRREDPNPPVLSVTPASYEDEWGKLKAAGADLVIFDTPARLDENTGRAIEIADLVVIPAKTTLKDLERVGATYDLVQKTSATKTLIVLNQVRAQGDRAKQAQDYIQSKGYALCPYSFGYRVAFEDADVTGQTPQETKQSQKATEEIQQVYKYICAIVHKTTNGVKHDAKETKPRRTLAAAG